ncbi:MAG TPA: hypothetical protein VGH38_04645 [Bryobacteraceae bacterium]
MALLNNLILPFVFLSFTSPAFTQVVSGGSLPLSCTASSGTPPTVRSSALTERLADLVLTCTGGPALSAGSVVPTADLTIGLGTYVTSRILASPQISEALLLIDEPGSGPAALKACDNFALGAAPGGCVQYAMSSANGVPIASGSPAALTPPANVFFGAVKANQVIFHGIPILPPVTAGVSRIFRFTNLRANVAGLGGGAFGTTQLLLSISVGGDTPITINNPVQIAGFFLYGLNAAVRNPDNTGPLSGTEGGILSPFSQSPSRMAVLQFTETFQDAFKTRVGDRSESGFVFQGLGDFNGNYPGMADYGTRLKASFHNLPPGVRLFVSTTNLAANTSSPTLSPPPAASTTDSYAVLVTGETALYTNGSAPAAGAATTVNGQATALAELPIVNGAATAAWEVVNANPSSKETFNFGVWASYGAAGTPAGPGTASVFLDFAPTYPGGLSESGQASQSLPLPRFTAASTPRAILTVGPSACQYTVLPVYGTLSPLSGSGSFTVTTTAQCLWSATSDSAWIHITTPNPGAGSGSGYYSFDPNSSPDSRTGSLLIAAQQFYLTQFGTAPPAIAERGVAESWTHTQGIAPGAWVSIYGSNLAWTTQQWQPPGNPPVIFPPIATTLGGVTVRMAGIPAPLQYVSPNFITALVPAGVPIGEVSVVVTNNTLSSAPFTVTSSTYLPAIYSVPSTPGYSVIAVDPASGQLLGTPAVDRRVVRAVRPGDTIDLYAIGLGPTTPAFTTDSYFAGSRPVAAPFTVVLGPATITPAFAALTATGLYQVRIAIPADMPAGDQPIRIDFGSAQSASGVYLTVQPR